MLDSIPKITKKIEEETSWQEEIGGKIIVREK